MRSWVNKLRNPPIQYQQGWTEFYKIKFYLTRDVLIPRPETELLVDEVLNLAKVTLPKHQSKLSVIDVGTGSGCIAIAIAKNLKDVGIVALDISQEALEVAIKNAKLNHIDDKKLVIIKNDLLEKFTVPPDIIVANLPYIPSSKLMLIDPLVRDFEPKLALDGGPDGFDLYRKMFTQMKEQNLYPQYLLAEIDEEQSEVARDQARRYFPSATIQIKKDLAKKDRFLIVKF